MAIMIPNLISDTKSQAEQTIFRWLRDDPKTNDWVVLHSYTLFKHKTLIIGEADFVILAPKLGIFVLEIKGGLVERIDGVWYFTGKNGKSEPKKRGPFEQAEEGVFSVLNLLKDKYGSSSAQSKLLFGFGCVFPDMIFNYSSPEFDNHIVFDQRNDAKIADFIIDLSKFWKEKYKNSYGFFDDNKLPSKNIIKEIANFLRPNFEDLNPLKSIFDTADRQIERLTAEQYDVLDGIEDNKRTLILGSAGTGKTLIAVQSLIKQVTVNNKRIGFFCYNNNLGEFIKEKTSNIANKNNSYVGTIHSFLYSFLMKKKLIDFGDAENPTFYSEILPNTFVEHFNDDFDFECFDAIIIDEAQDLITDEYLMVFDCLLKKGFNKGEWQLFADFENQDINSKVHFSESEARERIGNPACYRLTINCRNTFVICEEIENVANVKYKVNINQINGIPVNHIDYSTEEEAVIKFDALIDEFKNNHIEMDNIIILSPKRKDKSFVRHSKYKIIDYSNQRKKNTLMFSTIQSFKGLESQIVLLTDIEDYYDNKLMYVGISRAKVNLQIFETLEAHKQRISMVVKKYGDS